MAGLHLSRIDLSIDVEDGGRRESSNADTPLPVVGAFASLPLGPNTVAGAKMSVFLLDFDRYDGSLATVTADVRRALTDRVSIGVAYHYTSMNLDSQNDSLRGSLEFRHSGPALFLTAGF